MSKELIERLRADAEYTDDIGLSAEAADRIEDIEAQVKMLREALIQERDLRVFGQSPECGKTHFESIRDMRCAVYSNTDEALAATEQKP